MSFRGPSRTERPRRVGRPRADLLGALAVALLAAPAPAADVPEAVITLEAMGAVPQEQVGAAMPVRFALLPDGQAFVGGTSRLLSVRLSKEEAADLERRAAAIRKLPGLGSTVSFGPGPTGFRLSLRKGKPLDVLVQGDPTSAPPALQPLGRLIGDLLRFDHASLLPYDPVSYALEVREGRLAGGCRSWTLPVPLAEALAGPRVVPAAAVEGWPTGATPASVCSRDKAYVVTLRPLVPGERP